MDTGEIPDLAETSAQTANPPPATGARLGFLPGFLTPASRRTDPLTQELPSLDPEGGDDADPYGPPSRRPDRGTRTPTSATGKPERPDLAVTAELVVGLLGLAVAGAAWLVARRHRRTRVLREPTDRQLADVAEPMAKIPRRPTVSPCSPPFRSATLP